MKVALFTIALLAAAAAGVHVASAEPTKKLRVKDTVKAAEDGDDDGDDDDVVDVVNTVTVHFASSVHPENMKASESKFLSQTVLETYNQVFAEAGAAAVEAKIMNKGFDDDNSDGPEKMEDTLEVEGTLPEPILYCYTDIIMRKLIREANRRRNNPQLETASSDKLAEWSTLLCNRLSQGPFPRLANARKCRIGIQEKYRQIEPKGPVDSTGRPVAIQALITTRKDMMNLNAGEMNTIGNVLVRSYNEAHSFGDKFGIAAHVSSIEDKGEVPHDLEQTRTAYPLRRFSRRVGINWMYDWSCRACPNDDDAFLLNSLSSDMINVDGWEQALCDELSSGLYPGFEETKDCKIIVDGKMA
jgi:hypothetical protein